MKTILRKTFRSSRLTSIMARKLHAFESPRFVEFSRLKSNQGEDFLRGLTNYEEKVAFLNYGQSVGIPDLEKIANSFRSSPDYDKFKQVLINHINEMTPHTISQFIRVYINVLTQDDIDKIAKRLNTFFDNKGKDLNDTDIDLILDSVNYLLYIAKFGNKGVQMALFDVAALEDFYHENSSRLNVMNQVMFASLYRQQSGYKKSLVESIINFTYNKRAYIDTTKYLNILIVCFEEVFDDALRSNKLFTHKALKTHPMFAILEKFDQANLVHTKAPAIAKDKFAYLLNIMNACKVEGSLPHISEFLFDIFRNLIIIGSDVADILVLGNLLLNQKIDLTQDEANALAHQITEYLKRANDLPTELLAVLFLSKQASAGM